LGRLVHALQKQQQLRGIEPLTFRPEELAHQQVDLLPQERVLTAASAAALRAVLRTVYLAPLGSFSKRSRCSSRMSRAWSWARSSASRAPVIAGAGS
jgi:hypothetical protein